MNNSTSRVTFTTETGRTFNMAFVKEELSPISELSSLEDVKTVFEDVLKRHKYLYETKGHLFGDIKLENIMFYWTYDENGNKLRPCGHFRDYDYCMTDRDQEGSEESEEYEEIDDYEEHEEYDKIDDYDDYDDCGEYEEKKESEENEEK